jgi:hypothetical protein
MPRVTRRQMLQAGSAMAALAAVGAAPAPTKARCIDVPIDHFKCDNGTFTITYAGHTTKALAFECSAEEVAAALEEISGVPFVVSETVYSIDVRPADPALATPPDPSFTVDQEKGIVTFRDSVPAVEPQR